MSKLKSFLAATILLSGVGVSAMPPVQAEKVLEGQVCSTRVHQLTANIHWYNNLKDAEKVAQEQGKPIFWMHMLGKIDGAT